MILTMGGTIASLGESATATTIYKLDPDRNPVLDAVSTLADIADVEAEAFAHLASHDIPLDMVVELACRILALRAEGRIDGVVITHGTDTMEETAYLLDLLLPPGAPVIVTGAMRPASALSADGPLNLFNAVRVAACAEAAGQGVLICLNDRIGAARSTAKTHTSAPDAFGAGEQGFVGAITGSEIAFFQPGSNASRPYFDSAHEGDLPRVEILAAYLGMDESLFDVVIAAGAAGIVVAGTGNGSIPARAKPALARARDAGVIVVRSTRVGNGAVSAAVIDEEYGTIPAGFLSPQKARLLLMLALRETRDRAAIAAMFRAA